MLVTFDLVKIGYIHKAKGIKGHVSVSLDDGYEDLPNVGDFIFLEQMACSVPFRLMDIKQTNQTLYRFEGFETPESCAPILQLEMFVERDLLPVSSDNNSDNEINWVGYDVQDIDENEIGVVSKVEEYPEQTMLTIQAKDGVEHLLPVVPSWIVNDDYQERKKLVLDLPEGILSLE